MKPNLHPARRLFLSFAGLIAVLVGMTSAQAQTAVVETDHFSYLPQEPIAVSFRNGPGDPEDWIGIYPDGVIPGTQNSTAWDYVPGKEGTVLFPAGLNLAGDWKAFLLLDDGYVIAAQTAFRVVDPFAPFVRTDRTTYTNGQPISVLYTNGPANLADWIGLYPVDRLPGNGNSLEYRYVNPANPANGSVTFPSGLPTGQYVAYFLLNDGYDVLASEPFSVLAPPPIPARILTVQPASGTTGLSPLPTYRAAITNGTTRVTAAGVSLKLDGTAVTPVIDDQTTSLTVTYTPTALFENNSQHTFELVFTDDGTPPNVTTNVTTFTVKRIDLTLPTPLFLENFDATPEGQLPTGWTEVNYTEIQNPELDLANLDSASYATWVTVNASRFAGSFVTYSNPDNPQGWEDDYHRVLNFGRNYVVNGQLVTSLASGRVAFADSGYRNGVAQIMYLTSPELNLTGKTDIFLAFHSIWEQNQDSIAGVEYSIDNGQTWLPALYAIAQGDVLVDGENNTDAVATLNAQYGDVATYNDPITGEPRGGNYGAFLGAPIAANLAPFISGRVDDNTFESKRVELLRLAQADNQAHVRIRFFHAGTDSWYFGLDNVGVYSIPATQPPTFASHPASVTVQEGEAASLSVIAQGGGTLTFQWFKGTDPVPNGTGTSLNFAAAKLTDTGTYYVRVSNEGGSTNSNPAVLTVTPRPPAVTGVWNFPGLLTSEGVGTLAFATPATETVTTFGTTDGTTVPHIGGQPATYMRVPALTLAADGIDLTMPTSPNGSGGYLNQYSMVWDLYIPAPLNWTALFNSDPANGNDADFYATDTGTLGIGALGYSAADSVHADQWHRVAFVADLGNGRAAYYVDGVQVHQRTGASLRDGRFALYTGNDEGPDVRLFNEPSGSYTHELLLNSFRFTDRALTAAEVAELGGPSAAGIPSGIVPEIRLTITRSGNNVTLNWTTSGTFQVEKSSNLVPGSWQNLGSPTTGTSATDAADAGAAFYRVKRLP